MDDAHTDTRKMGREVTSPILVGVWWLLNMLAILFQSILIIGSIVAYLYITLKKK